MDRKMKVQLEGNLESQALARAVAAAYLAEMDPTMDELTEVKTAVSEAVSNVAIHAYPGTSCGDMILEFARLSQDTVMIKVTDKGVGIENIAQAMEPLFTTDEGEMCSGMGFTVMESFMDKIRVDSRPGSGTTVTMIKKLDTYYGI
ncbi:MAG: anti-sigma F factor [Firmicutes bacterium]|nr:anti-sigma F factor [Bacillota bacterium]